MPDEPALSEDRKQKPEDREQMGNVVEIKPEKRNDPRDTLKGCKAYASGDYTSVEWCRRNRGQWCKTNGTWCSWRKV